MRAARAAGRLAGISCWILYRRSGISMAQVVIFLRTMAKPESIGREPERERGGGWARADGLKREEMDVLWLGDVDRLK